MRCLFSLLLGSLLLGGCASQAQDPSGIWINQPAIDATVEGGHLREALLAYGPNLEWQIDASRQRASYSNGFEHDEGQLLAEADGRYRVRFYGDHQEWLSLSRDQLLQAPSATWPAQHFVRATAEVAYAAPGSHFEQALYRAYLGGNWIIQQGLGQGGLVLFQADGRVQGMPGVERYALCLAGDCASMSGDTDSIWLQLGEQGQSWLFEREGQQLRIFSALNRAQPDEVPEYAKGPQRWLLERQ